MPPLIAGQREGLPRVTNPIAIGCCGFRKGRVGLSQSRSHERRTRYADQGARKNCPSVIRLGPARGPPAV